MNIRNERLEYGHVSIYTGQSIHPSQIDLYNRHVDHIKTLLYFHPNQNEDDSLSGKELTLALDNRHKCFISIIN
jgi:hypothetical protein